MARIMMVYPDGQTTYAILEDTGNPIFTIGKQQYTPEDIAATGATAVVNNPELLRQLHSYGLQVRPTPKQHTVTISVSADTRDRLKRASKVEARSVSSILEDLAVEWLTKSGY